MIVHKSNNERILVIPDLHAPYMHQDTVKFLTAVKKKYKPSRVVQMGDECFPKDAEVLTEKGFIKFEDYVELDKVKVAQYKDNGEIEYVYPERIINKPFNGQLLEIKHNSYYSLTTKNHMIVKVNPETNKIHKREAWDTKGTNSWYIPRSGVNSGPGINLSDDDIKLIVATQADGTLDKGTIKFGLRRQRKIDRIKTILSNLNIEHTVNLNSRGDTTVRIIKSDMPDYLTKNFNPSFISEMSLEQKQLMLSELVHWDGTTNGVGVRVNPGNKDDLDFLQAMAHTCGYETNNSCSYLDIHFDRNEKTSQKSAKFNNVDYKGNVYCVTVPTGMIVVRQAGHVVVTGNCDKHAMSFHDSDPDLDSAGVELQKAIDCLKPLYKLFPKMDLLDSNHGSMVFRKAKHHGIPVAYIREYGEVLQCPDTWVWHNDLYLKYKDKPLMYFCHGISADVIKVVQQRGVSVIQGHFHSLMGVRYLSNPHNLLFGLQTGCLVDKKSQAFDYSKLNLKRFLLGCSVIIKGEPTVVPMQLNSKGRWIGRLV